jgi:hypothetical protein
LLQSKFGNYNSILNKNLHFFRQYIGENILKIITSVPNQRSDGFWLGLQWFPENASAGAGLPDFLFDGTYQNGKNVPNSHRLYQIAAKHTKWP